MDLTFFESMMFFVHLSPYLYPWWLALILVLGRFFGVYILKYVQIVGVGKKEGWGMGEKV